MHFRHNHKDAVHPTTKNFLCLLYKLLLDLAILFSYNKH